MSISIGSKRGFLRRTNWNGQMLPCSGIRRRDLLSRFHKFVSNNQQLWHVSEGHPQILVNSESQNIDDYFGLAKVSILAAEKVFHPVLSVKMNGKLMFPLCGKCVEEQLDRPWHERTNLCPHSDAERTLHGTWCTEELKIMKIHEVWYFPKDQRKEGLYAPYVNLWLKYKTEASGWPRHCDTQEQKDQYVEDFEAKEGIKQENVQKNPGRKQVAKFMLNW